MNQQELKNVLEMHRKWVMGESDGQRADLRSANLYGADLRSADLYGADLRSADLYGADLRSANLYGADLRSANLYGADLRSADLSGIKEDFFQKLEKAVNEVVYLYKTLVDGRINGSAYEGECACFAGTIANARKINYLALETAIGLKPDSSSSTEKWFLAIKQGDTPENNVVSAVTVDWVLEFMRNKNISIPIRSVVWSDAVLPTFTFSNETVVNGKKVTTKAKKTKVVKKKKN